MTLRGRGTLNWFPPQFPLVDSCLPVFNILPTVSLPECFVWYPEELCVTFRFKVTTPFYFYVSPSIDCAGILKLRNADIELKRGETDIGRKNTRVRVVFRVAVPQQDGQMLWLQAASIPVECCEWITAAYQDELHATTQIIFFSPSDIKSERLTFPAVAEWGF